MPLLIHELLHILILIPPALFLWKRYQRKDLVVLLFILGIGMDVDHLLEYFLVFDHWSLTFFLSGDSFLKLDRVIIFFHGWEYVLLLSFLLFHSRKRRKPVILAVLLGITGHLVWDQLSNTSNPLGYFILYHLLHGFSRAAFGMLVV